MAHTPASSHGTVFNGGTITGPLVIDLTAHADAIPLTIIGVPGGSQNLIEVQDGDTQSVFEVIQQAGHSAGTYVASFTNTAPALTAEHNGAAPTANVVDIVSGLVRNASGFTSNAYFATLKHSAPADAEVLAGELCLWFDQTNGVGATKLMVKAKSADGTVKAATIVLA